MSSISRKILFLVFLCFVSIAIMTATPSSIIWIPSTDIQALSVWHLGVDNYFTVLQKSGMAYPTDVNLTVGLFSFGGVQMEIGVDYFEPMDSPLQFNGKIGVAEGFIFDSSPAVAVGGMNLGIKHNVTDANIGYLLLSKTFDGIGRITGGGFFGNPSLLMNPNGQKENTGALLAIERPMKELSDKVTFSVDFMSGKSAFGAVSGGVTYAFTPEIALIVGYCKFLNDAPSMATLQLDINL